MANQNFTLNFNPKIDDETSLTKLVSHSYLLNQKFFDQEITNIKITFLYTRSQMDKVCGHKTPDWMVGFANKKQVYIFSPSVFSKVSSHPKSNFTPVLTHEITHIFTNQILGFFYPKWLYEGLAGYIAGQCKNKSIGKIQDFSKLHDQKSWNQNHNHHQAFVFTKHLFDLFGKPKMLQFLAQLPKSLGRHHYLADFSKFFNLFFGNDFDQVISEIKSS